MTSRISVRGTTFLVTDAFGDAAAGTEGFYVDDTRHLSRWRLSVDGAPLRLLGGHGTDVVLAPATARGEDPGCTVFRGQAVDAGVLTERLRIRSHRHAPSTVVVTYEVAADFADQFELRGSRQYVKPGASSGRTFDNGVLRLAYRRGEYGKDTVVRAHPAPILDAHRLQWTLTVPPLAEVELLLQVSVEDTEVPFVRPADVRTDAEADAARFLEGVSVPDHGVPGLRAAIDRGLADLADLRVPVPGRPDLRVPGAGVPWFLTLFGRDSLMTSLFALPYLSALAADTLRALAAFQGSTVDDSRIEQPGKIVHELRAGELSRFGQTPYARYYGSVDATPLFLVLLGRQRALAAELEQQARAAVDWMFRYGGLDEHGYLVYRTDGPGLVHQCWKDSDRSICFASGEPAHGPIAACEVQGYAYEALTSTAVLAREVWDDPAFADRLTARAERLRTDFLRDFWLPEQDFVALALDGAGRQADALASNAGHVLWTGILPDEHARTVGRRLAEPDFFSGWGIRTLAADQPPYHPVSYHNGGVWPHDTAIAVAGLARSGLPAHARTVADGLIAAAVRQPDHRLPEVLTGYGPAEFPAPVRYPHSCSPQAWAAAAPLLIATALGA